MTASEQLSLLPDTPLAHEVTDIPLDQLPPDADLEGDPPKKAMIDVFRATGVCPHILLRINGSGYTVIDGRRRIKAWRRIHQEALEQRARDFTDPQEGWLSVNRWCTIPAIVVETDAVPADLITLAAHAHRHDNLASSLAAIERLKEAGGTERSIARATGMSLGTIHRTLQLLKLVPDLREAAHDGRITSQVAEQCAKLPGEVQRALASDLEQNGRLRLHDVAARRTGRSSAVVQTVLEDILAEPMPVQTSTPWQPPTGWLSAADCHVVLEWLQSLPPMAHEGGKRTQSQLFAIQGGFASMSITRTKDGA